MDETLQAWTMTMVEKAIDNSKADDMTPTAALIRVRPHASSPWLHKSPFSQVMLLESEADPFAIPQAYEPFMASMVGLPPALSFLMALQEALTEREGPLWHVILSRSPEVGLAVEASPGSLLDVRVHKYRVVLWRHHLDLRFIDRLLTLRGAAAVLLIGAIVCFSNYCQRRRLGCGNCCLETDPIECADDTVLCGESELAAAHACFRVKQLMLTCACTLMFGGLFLNIAAKGREVQLPRTRPQAASADGRKKKRR